MKIISIIYLTLNSQILFGDGKSKSNIQRDSPNSGTFATPVVTANEPLWSLPLLILVTSSPHNFDKRQVIRSRWNFTNRYGDLTNNAYKLVFLVGQSSRPDSDASIWKESSRHGDLLIGDFKDTYQNLTLKVMHGLRWASMQKVDFVLKTDDDCFVNVPLLLQFLDQYNVFKKQLYVGNVRYKSPVVRNPKNKWYVPFDKYPFSYYPPYASGHGYLLSVDSVQDILSAFDFGVEIFPNEDAFVGVLAEMTGIEPLHSSRFHLHSYNIRACNMRYLIVLHRVDSEKQKELQKLRDFAMINCNGPLNVVTTWD